MTEAIPALASVLLAVVAQFCLKAGVKGSMEGWGWLTPMTLLGLSLYGVSAIVWLYVLNKWDVSKAYPIVGLGFVVTVIVGSILGESVGVARWVGVLMICAGVAFVARS